MRSVLGISRCIKPRHCSILERESLDWCILVTNCSPNSKRNQIKQHFLITAPADLLQVSYFVFFKICFFHCNDCGDNSPVFLGLSCIFSVYFAYFHPQVSRRSTDFGCLWSGDWSLKRNLPFSKSVQKCLRAVCNPVNTNGNIWWENKD